MNNIDKVSKDLYKDIVNFTLEGIFLAVKNSENKEYDLIAKIINYYELTIVPEGKISMDEFLELCKEVWK